LTIGEAIKELRKNQGISQGELAKTANISQTALSQIENGRRPGVETFSRISKALKTPEPLIHLMTLEKADIPESKQFLFDSLFPVIESLIKQISG
jgi:transcriptional regulator with XRE-family HTH domain